MPEQDPRMTRAEALGRQHEFALLEAQHLTTNDASGRQPADQAERHEEQQQATREDRHQDHHQKHVRKRVDDVDGAHHQTVEPTARVARDGAVILCKRRRSVR